MVEIVSHRNTTLLRGSVYCLQLADERPPDVILLSLLASLFSNLEAHTVWRSAFAGIRMFGIVIAKTFLP